MHFLFDQVQTILRYGWVNRSGFVFHVRNLHFPIISLGGLTRKKNLQRKYSGRRRIGKFISIAKHSNYTQLCLCSSCASSQIVEKRGNSLAFLSKLNGPFILKDYSPILRPV